jgi:V-type H+-transporting ATPase subunit E
MAEERQIQSMIDFIEREAQEKADELDQAAQEEYDVEKMRLVEAEKAKIRANLEKRKKQAEVDRRVARANHAKGQRLRMMQDRAVILETLQEQAKKNVMAIVNDAKKYQQLMTDIIRQSVHAIQADTTITCRKQDEAVVRKLLDETQQWYQAKNGKPVKLAIDKTYLVDAEAWGGVVLRSTDGRIVCDNTLSYRAANVFVEQLPTIRYYLFNENADITKA